MNILLADDDIGSRTLVADFLRALGHEIKEVSNGEEAVTVYRSGDYTMILSDIRMPGMTGLELLSQIKNEPISSKADVVLFTGYGDMNTAIEALRGGAYDYLIKPINVEELALVTERIAEHQALLRENKVLTHEFENQLKAATEETRDELTKLRQTLSHREGLDCVGKFSLVMERIFEAAQKYHQDRSMPVLIQGETGTGKEIVAKMIHYGNWQDPRPFIDINCATLTAALFESELFGYEAGAFTGSSHKGQRGKLDLAHGGTLFLDEIAEIPLELQGKLLRVLQERSFYRVGGLKKHQVDVRLIFATNADLQIKVKEGKFREDLYYRLKVGHIDIPPLRQRKEEILPLAQMFLEEFTRQKKKKISGINREAAKLLEEYPWPGNIRELRNVIEWVTFMYDNTELMPTHFEILTFTSAFSDHGNPHKGSNRNFPLPVWEPPLEEYVRRIIMKALEFFSGNKSETAKYLGISRRSIYRYLEQESDILQHCVKKCLT